MTTQLDTQALEAALLPCPFCGGDALGPKFSGGRWFVQCETAECRATGSSIYGGGPHPSAAETAAAKASAIVAWNRRTHAQSPVEPQPKGDMVPDAPRIKPQIIETLREWAEFEQDGGNVEQGAAIDIILDWYDRQIKADTRRPRIEAQGHPAIRAMKRTTRAALAASAPSAPVAEVGADTVAAANLIREMAYAAAQFVATDDRYWREQMDYLEGQLKSALAGERPSPIYAEDVAREINGRVKS